MNWFSTYHVHHRVTDHFREGRAFLLGDAAHIHSPAGGQGMNTGIGDAINLAWKLAAVRGWPRAGHACSTATRPSASAFARRLVATTDRAFSLATAEGPVADFVRTRLAPVVAASALSLEPVREFMFRTVSQITLNYRGGPLSVGEAGALKAATACPGSPAPTRRKSPRCQQIAWQVFVYGEPRPALATWCAGQGVALHAFAWRQDHKAVGVVKDAAYLLRPDTYIALADPRADPAAIERYFAERGIRPGVVA